MEKTLCLRIAKIHNGLVIDRTKAREAGLRI